MERMERTLRVLSILEDVCVQYEANSKKARAELRETRKSEPKTKGEVAFSLFGATVATQKGLSLIGTLCEILEPLKDEAQGGQEAVYIALMAAKLFYLFPGHGSITERMERILKNYAPKFSVKDPRPKTE